MAVLSARLLASCTAAIGQQDHQVPRRPKGPLPHRLHTRVAHDEAIPAPPVVALWFASLPLTVHDPVHLVESEHGSRPPIAVITDDPHVHIADLVEVLSGTGHEADLVSVTSDSVEGAVPHARSIALCLTPPSSTSRTADQYTTHPLRAQQQVKEQAQKLCQNP
ncbi:hypothetical protein [Streptomyces sp. NPDC051662]|uniref:hypothetical protein n=1 Tax=Streptomyces sp. NPDC051662 TaxID=3154750 RepID=UPI00342DFD48